MENIAVDESGTFAMQFITAKPSGEEQGKLTDSAEVDLDIGKSNDFETTLSATEWDAVKLGYGCRIFIPNTEYGGIIKDIESVTAKGNVVLRGDT